MSTLKTTNLQNASAASPAITLAADGSATANLSSLNGGPIAGTRNRVINGDMRIDQRNAGASVTSNGATYTLDRWQAYSDVGSKYSVQQVSDAPTGFTNSIRATSSSAYTVGTNEVFGLFQYIEGFNVADLGFGAAGATTVTLSFWVKSSLTGTFGGALINNGYTRAYPFTYSIAAANTWEQKTLTIAGDATGTWLKTNGVGLGVILGLGCGSGRSATAGAWTATNLVFSATGATSIVGTNGATFYLTGVQLEPGTVATPFEQRSYGQELALCQRYYFRCNAMPIGMTQGSSQPYSGIKLPVTMRSSPSLDSSGNSWAVSTGSAGTVGLRSGTGYGPSPDAVTMYNISNNWTNNADVTLSAGFSAEL